MNDLYKERIVNDLRNTIEGGVNEQQFLILVNESLKDLLLWDENKIKDTANKYWTVQKELEGKLAEIGKQMLDNANKIYENILKL